ncbi:hypothetical protein [Desulfosporosinus burensis]
MEKTKKPKEGCLSNDKYAISEVHSLVRDVALPLEIVKEEIIEISKIL